MRADISPEISPRFRTPFPSANPARFAHVTAWREDAFRVPVRVPHPRQQMIFADRHRTRVVEIFRQLRVIAGDEVNRLPIRSERDAVRAVLAAALAGADEFRFVELI